MKRKRKSKLAKRKENPNSSYWRKRADTAWSKVIHQVWHEKCAVCGCEGVQAHHLVSRSVHHLRHTIRNGIALCLAHHKWSNRLSAHGAPLAFAMWLQENHPDIYQWVMDHRHEIAKPDYKRQCEALEAIRDGTEERKDQ